MSYHTTHDTSVKTQKYNGALTTRIRHQLGMGPVGCPYQGTTACHACPFEPVAECDYNCYRCEHRGYCKCSHDQTARLVAWGLVE